MKVKAHYMYKQLGNQHLVLPIGIDQVEFKGMLRLNETAAFMFQQLQSQDLTQEDLVRIVSEHYQVESAVVEEDVAQFLALLQDKQLLDV